MTDPVISSQSDPDLDRLRRAAQTRSPIAIADVPDQLRRRFTSKDGDLGGYVFEEAVKMG